MNSPLKRASSSRRQKATTAFKHWMAGFQDRLQHVMAVIDDALHSDSLKDRVWAVEQILKRLKPQEEMAEQAMAEKAMAQQAAKQAPPKSPLQQDVSNLSDAELIERIRQLCRLPEQALLQTQALMQSDKDKDPHDAL